MPQTLQNLIEHLDSLTGRAPLPQLADRLRQVQMDCADVAGAIRFSERGYASKLLRAGPWYELFVFCWKSGQRSPVHDHAATSCAVRVLRGVATETLFELAANGVAWPVSSRELGPGDVSTRQDLDLHEIANLQPGDADLVTLHVYSPPMGEVGIYPSDRG